MSAAIGAFDREREPDILPSRDRWEATRRAFARAVALALHVLLLLGVSLTPVVRAPPKEPPTIPIELVMEPPPPAPKSAQHPPPPPPRVQPNDQPQPKAQPGPQPDIPHQESGGSPALKSGAPAKTEPRPAQEQPAEVPPQPQPEAQPAAAPAIPTPAPALPLVEAPLPIAPPAQATATTKPPPPKAAKEAVQRPSTSPAATTATPPQVASLPPKTAQPKPQTEAPPGPVTIELSAPDWSEGERRGEGGGDRYLNALRDAIVSKIIYPDSAHGKTAIVKYVIVMERSGRMLRVTIQQPSGLPALDRAGQDAIENSMPFQPLPIRIQENRIAILATLYIGPNGARSP